MAVKITKDRMQDAMAQIATADQHDVLIGIPQEHAQRGEDGVSNVELAYIHENGSPARNIPARPHIGPGIDAARGDIELIARRSLLAALDGNPSAIINGLHQIGAVAVSSIQHKIASGPFTPLQPQTIRRKGSSRPLIDTGAYRQSISYVVREK